ncbi:MAG: S-methyl-5'-thioadenosine phosphorylase [Myxococcota bacterium]
MIGGSGLYKMEGLADVKEHRLETPFGVPSDAILSGILLDELPESSNQTRLLFLPRHGRFHDIPPHQVNYRANIWALKKLGAGQVVSVSAVGSMKESIAPGDLVFVDQFIDRTRSRPNTFFEDAGVVAHVEFAQPVDEALSDCLYRAAVKSGVRAHRGGTYVCIEGPQFSTRAESDLFRSWGVDVIGMTNLPEARLAREAELPYATMALATDYDCWHADHGSVSVEAVLELIRSNVKTAQAVLKHALSTLPDPSKSPASFALRHAVLTSPNQFSQEAWDKLGLLLEKHISKPGTA